MQTPKYLMAAVLTVLLAASVSGQGALKLEWESNVTAETGLYETVLGGFNFEDINGDGTVDILLPRRKGSETMTDRIVCLNGKTGAIQWVYPPPDQDNLPGDPMCVPAIDDLDGDGALEVVLIGRGAWAHCIDGNGNLKWTFTPREGSDNSATIIDLDDDGKKEVLFATGGSGLVYCLNFDGTERWTFQMKAGTNSGVTAWDVDQDGDIEVIVPCKDGLVIYCLSYAGVERWRFETGDQPGQTTPVIADIDRDNEYEILIMVPDELKLYCLNFYGTEKWSYNLDPTAALTGYVSEHTVAGDIDGDGFMEVFVSDLGLGAGGPEPHLYCLNHDGSLRWTAPFIAFTTLLGDFTGDGQINVVGARHFWQIVVLNNMGQPEYVWDHLQYNPNVPIDPNFGAPLWGPGDPKQCMGDLDGDGKTEWFLMGDPDSVFYSFTVDGAYDEQNMIWTRGYRTAGNVAAIPIVEGVLLPVAVVTVLGALRRLRA